MSLRTRERIAQCVSAVVLLAALWFWGAQVNDVRSMLALLAEDAANAP